VKWSCLRIIKQAFPPCTGRPRRHPGHATRRKGQLFLFFILSSLELSDTKVYEPCIRTKVNLLQKSTSLKNRLPLFSCTISSSFVAKPWLPLCCCDPQLFRASFRGSLSLAVTLASCGADYSQVDILGPWYEPSHFWYEHVHFWRGKSAAPPDRCGRIHA